LISGAREPFTLRQATLADLDTIKSLADDHRSELGFVLRPALARSIERSELVVATNTTDLIAFVEYHHRRDAQTTLYHIVVAPDYHRQGIGRWLIERLADEARAAGKEIIALKCPANLPANDFYAHTGWSLAGSEPGKRRPLNLWQLPLDASDDATAGL
jgi:GNAT superfamily N-acetyltransferase